MECEELKEYYGEFVQFQNGCKFIGCVHINEPVCGVKNALSDDEPLLVLISFDGKKIQVFCIVPANCPANLP